jgi:hypothetical protein
VGELGSWTAEGIVVTTSEGDQGAATDELVSLRLAATGDSDAHEESTSGLVELTDGTRLPADDIRVAGDRLAITLATPGRGEPRQLTVATSRVSLVRLKPLKPSASEQWQEMRGSERTSDVLVVAKRGGESLDYVEGVLGDVTSDKIEFKLDGDPLRIDRDKAAGFIYYRRSREAVTEPRCVLHGRNGFLANATGVQLAEGMLHVTTLAGVKFEWPLAEVHFADFSAGKIRYLSDMAQSSARWFPLVSLPASASQAATFGQPRRDQSAFGGPLTLYYPDADSAPAAGQPRVFSKGLAVRSRSELVYRMPPGFARFTAIAGIDPATRATGNVKLTIYGDDHPLYEAAVSGEEPPQQIEMDIADIKRLKIVVDFGKNLDTGDWLNLCDARLVK